MKYLLTLAVTALVLSLHAQEKIMTFNIRYDNPADVEDSWKNRRHDMINLVKEENPSIICFQEVLGSQLHNFYRSLTDYDFYGIGREDGRSKGEYAPVFFNRHKYEAKQFKTYWLSDTPDYVSTGWDACTMRVVTYVKLENKKTKEVINVFNTHFDHKGKIARRKSAELILSKIDEMKLWSEKVIVAGDLNAWPISSPIKILGKKLNDSYDKYKWFKSGPIGTFNAFIPYNPVLIRLDYIFTNKIEVKSYKNIRAKTKAGRWMSDHCPVVIEIA